MLFLKPSPVSLFSFFTDTLKRFWREEKSAVRLEVSQRVQEVDL